jgi:hypothetical protein
MFFAAFMNCFDSCLLSAVGPSYNRFETPVNKEFMKKNNVLAYFSIFFGI